jgi:sugar phosphate isomerase/epimerase
MIDGSNVVLSHFSLRYAGLEERVAAASAAGFSAIGLFTGAFVAAEESGLSASAQRSIADRYDIAVEEIEALRPWWGDEADRHRAESSETTAFRMADAFGCRYVQVIGPYDGSIDHAATCFAGLCDRAAEHGLTVGIEFLPFNNIPDAAVALSIVAAADRPNGGVCVDSWHHFRGAADNGLLRALTSKWVAAVQLDDGPMEPDNPDYYTDCLENRRVPGEGEFDLVGLVRLLDDMDVSVPVSLEVISTELQALPAVEAATRIHEGFRRVLSAART